MNKQRVKELKLMCRAYFHSIGFVPKAILNSDKFPVRSVRGSERRYRKDYHIARTDAPPSAVTLRIRNESFKSMMRVVVRAFNRRKKRVGEKV